MKWFLALLLPPIAVLMYSKKSNVFFNILLCFFGYFPAVIHAILVLKDK